jgi:hypothetical protein
VSVKTADAPRRRLEPAFDDAVALALAEAD